MSVLQVTSCGRQIDLAVAQDLSITLEDSGIGDSIAIPVCDGSLTVTAEDFSPFSLFQSGEQGVWFDPSDFSSMSQDDAGATPVTAVEQAVGRILDKSGRGNHATQATPTARPILRARYNLLTYSEQFNNAAWSLFGVLAFGSGSTANATTAPDGTSTADLITETAGGGQHIVFNTTNHSLAINTQYVFSCAVKAGTRTAVAIQVNTVTNGASVVFDLLTGTATQTNTSVEYTISSSITSLGNGWYRCSLTFSSTVSTASTCVCISNSTTPALTANKRPTYSGDGTSGLYIWGADLRLANDGVVIPVYQRIAAATDYDTSGFLPYLAFDGTDDFLVTGAVTPGVDKVQVFAGVRKNADVAGIIAEYSSSYPLNNGSFQLTAASASGSNYLFGSKGTASSIVQVTIAAPDTAVLVATGDISGDRAELTRNSATNPPSSSDQGTGNFLAYQIYIGSRGGTSTRLNGRIYGLIIRFSAANLDASAIANAERWINVKTGAY